MLKKLMAGMAGAAACAKPEYAIATLLIGAMLATAGYCWLFASVAEQLRNERFASPLHHRRW